MINLTDTQYAAIGRLAVQSGTLERELEEYFRNLKTPLPRAARTLGPKLASLKDALSQMAAPSASSAQLGTLLGQLTALVEHRNAVIHGVWSAASNAPLELGNVLVKGKRGGSLHAREIESLARKMRAGRKLLLRLLHDNLPMAAGSKRVPRSSASELEKRFRAA